MTAIDEYQRSLHAHIEKFGCSITLVFDPEEIERPFPCSTGIARPTTDGVWPWGPGASRGIRSRQPLPSGDSG